MSQIKKKNYLIRKRASTMIETHRPNKFLNAHQKKKKKSRNFAQIHNWINKRTDLIAQHLKCCFACSEMQKVVRYNSLELCIFAFYF